MTLTTYKSSTLNLEYYENFLSEEDASDAYDIIENNIEWGKSKDRKRLNMTFGDEGLTYKIVWYGKTTYRKTIDWKKLPVLLDIKNKVEEMTSEQYNICVVQRYPNGNIGINPHRDREMKEGTTICGISLGQERILNMSRNENSIDIPLKNGSMYVFNPPTNDYWAHSIKKDKSKKPRISLTFRNYAD